jgi:hypothetical protein
MAYNDDQPRASDGKWTGGLMDSHWYLYVIRLPMHDYAVAYVGVSKRPKTRFGTHRAPNNPAPISQAIKACGPRDVIFEVVESGERDFIYAREIQLIRGHNTRWPNGYNRTAGGHGCRDPLPQTRAKLAAVQLGRSHKAETKAHLSVIRKGRKNSQMHNQNISLALTRRSKESRMHAGQKISVRQLGKKFTKQRCINMSVAHKGKPWSVARRAAHEARYGV